ncbi:hypothetical protein [Paenibacillus sp. MER TA 81-3]|uniref:hypothetical protein n=1 Tax=Paenibacillus sp. MER TA 81-3 TaxID=2939573 RepID=UPI00203B2C55|nr:hypothetical protein [Paenibacillus sp. MER TA 81-3]
MAKCMVNRVKLTGVASDDASLDPYEIRAHLYSDGLLLQMHKLWEACCSSADAR